MRRSGFVHLSGSFGRQIPQLPVGSVLALADRRPEAIVTIGRWRIVGTPGRPPGDNSEACPAPQQGSSERAGHQRRLQQPGSRRALPQLAPERPAPEQQVSEQPVGATDRRQHERRGQAPRRVHRVPSACQGFGDQNRDQHRTQRSRRPARAADRLPALEPQAGSWAAGSAVSWALLSQVFWIPLVAIDLHDRWVAHQRDVTPPGQPLPPAPIARATSVALNDLLGAVRPAQQLAGQAAQVVRTLLADAVRAATSHAGVLLSSAGSGASSLLERPFTQSLDSPASDGWSSKGAPRAATAGLGSISANTMLGRVFTRAQLLGGSISLEDLQEGPMSPLALAERALQRGSGDPLAPLPSLWREPMRQALLRLPGAPPQLTPAWSVIVPSRAVLRPVEVPLALQSDGSVDVLQPPSDPAVLREIEGWSRRQRPPASGSLQPALVHLHPLPDASAAAAVSAADADRGTASSRASAAGVSRIQVPPQTPQPSPQHGLAAAAAPPVPPAPSPGAASSASAGSTASIPVPILTEAPAAPLPAAAAAADAPAP